MEGENQKEMRLAARGSRRHSRPKERKRERKKKKKWKRAFPTVIFHSRSQKAETEEDLEPESASTTLGEAPSLFNFRPFRRLAVPRHFGLFWWRTGSFSHVRHVLLFPALFPTARAWLIPLRRVTSRKKWGGRRRRDKTTSRLTASWHEMIGQKERKKSGKNKQLKN